MPLSSGMKPGGRPSRAGAGEGCATAEPARGIAAAADGCKEWARFSNTEAPSVGQGLGPDKPRSAHRLVGDFLRAAGVCIALAFALLLGGSVVAAETKAAGRRLEALHRVVHARRDRRARRSQRAGIGRPCTSRASATPASSSRRSPAARSTSTPSTPARSCAKCSSATAIPSLDELNALARAARTEGGGAARLQQHLCAGDARATRPTRLRHRAHLRPAQAGSRPLRLGLSHEFLQRADGWPALKAGLRLPLRRRRAASTTASPTTRSRRTRST